MSRSDCFNFFSDSVSIFFPQRTRRRKDRRGHRVFKQFSVISVGKNCTQCKLYKFYFIRLYMSSVNQCPPVAKFSRFELEAAAELR